MTVEENTSQLTNEQRTALENFRDLKISLEDLRASQVGRLDFNFAPTGFYTRGIQKYAAPAEPGVLVTRKTLIQAYARWVAGAVSNADLADWASMLTMNDDFSLDENEQELIAEWLNRIVVDNDVTNPNPL